VIENRAQSHFAFTQGVLSMLALRDIEVDPSEMGRRAIVFAAQAAVGMAPDCFPIRPENSVFANVFRAGGPGPLERALHHRRIIWVNTRKKQIKINRRYRVDAKYF